MALFSPFHTDEDVDTAVGTFGARVDELVGWPAPAGPATRVDIL